MFINVQPVREAFVPIIKAVIKGVDIDFAFATVNREKVSGRQAIQIGCMREN
jgi:poly(A) polymerase Pap1